MLFYVSLFLFWMFSPVSLMAHDLVDLKLAVPSIKIDFRYATHKNAFGSPLYSCNRIFIHRHAASRLKRVQEDLAKLGIGLIVHEGYRPGSVQNIIDGLRPGNDACRHRKGLGIDVSIYYLEGSPLALPSDYDEVSPQACRKCIVLPAHVYHNSALLEKCMRKHGFEPQIEKWWHFDLIGWDYCEDLDLEYSDLFSCRTN